jgi:hypothetical protein
MNDVRSAWKDAGERLSSLGSALKTHYDEQRGDDAARTKEEVGDAVKRLTGAVQDAFEALGAAAKDTAVRDDAKRAGQSVAGALSATFSEISGDLRRVADRGQTTDAGPSAGSPPASSTEGPPGSSSEGEEPPRVEPWGTP